MRMDLSSTSPPPSPPSPPHLFLRVGRHCRRFAHPFFFSHAVVKTRFTPPPLHLKYLLGVSWMMEVLFFFFSFFFPLKLPRLIFARNPIPFFSLFLPRETPTHLFLPLRGLAAVVKIFGLSPSSFFFFSVPFFKKQIFSPLPSPFSPFFPPCCEV